MVRIQVNSQKVNVKVKFRVKLHIKIFRNVPTQVLGQFQVDFRVRLRFCMQHAGSRPDECTRVLLFYPMPRALLWSTDAHCN